MTGTTSREGPQRVALLEAMGAELRSLGALVDGVQDALSPALSPAILSHPGVMASLQDLDRLAQTVRALATVASRLAETPGQGEGTGTEAILATVPLADLVIRLGGTRPREAPGGSAGQPDEGWDDGFSIPSLWTA